MGIFRQFPYSNFHDMNMDWLIKEVKRLAEEWAEYNQKWITDHEDWLEMKTYIENYFDTLDLTAETRAIIQGYINDGTIRNMLIPEMPNLVSSWLADNISQGSVVYDKTLRIENASADALVTGEHIRALEGGNPIMATRRYNPGTVEHHGVTFTENSNGSITISGASGSPALYTFYYDTDKLPDWCYPGQKLLTHLQNAGTAILELWFYNGATLISDTSTKDIERVITVPDNATGLLMRIKIPANTSIDRTVVPRVYTGYSANRDYQYFMNRLISDVGNIRLTSRFVRQNGFITTGGQITSLDSGYHSNQMRILPNTKHYLHYALDDTVGAFYDINGRFISLLMVTDLTDEDIIPGSNYVKGFISPNNACYFAQNYNLANEYKVGVFTKNALIPAFYADIDIPHGLPNVQIKRNKKLAVIGDSYAGRDRYLDNGTVIDGWQEMPGSLYTERHNFSYSGGTWSDIYHGVVNDISEINDYDEFILIGGYNGMGVASYEMGSLGDDNTVNPDTTTMLGAMRATIDAIYNANPNAKIYVCTNIHNEAYYTYNTTRNRMKIYREEIFRAAPILSYEIIDLETKAGITKANRASNLLADGVHLNQDGNLKVGARIFNHILFN